MRTEGLLTQSQQLTVELQSRQSELQQTNEELGTKAKLLADQNAEVERKNAEVEQARRALEEKAAELALTSKYKSEFLANMSHELRTPLNSILILSQQLAENARGNLSDKQVEFSRNINSSGSDLLHLINDILDLSKIESGTVTVEIEEIAFTGLRDTIDRNFRHVAEAKNLPFQVRFAPTCRARWRATRSDCSRFSRTCSRTPSSSRRRATCDVRVAMATRRLERRTMPVLSTAKQVVAFTVEDTGIGVPPDKQRLIFEAFQQADAGTSRKYGGTGLGLAISRELAVLLGGEIKLASVHGQGSDVHALPAAAVCRPDGAATDRPDRRQRDRRSASRDGGAAGGARRAHRRRPRRDRARATPVLLIIEDDPHYARILLGLARDKGFKGIVATKGAHALALARQFRPAAISLDIFLPDMLGWTVLNQLKLDPATRHIPVQIVTLEEERQHGLARGAFAYLVKEPTTDGLEAAFERIKEFTQSRTKRLLIVEDNPIERSRSSSSSTTTTSRPSAVGSGEAALTAHERAGL